MIEHLKLRRPIYRKTAAFGHFGRTEDTFTWEATDKAAILREAARLARHPPNHKENKYMCPTRKQRSLAT